GVAGVSNDGSLLEFHASEVRVRERIRENSQVSILVMDCTKFGRIAPAYGENIRDVDHVILDQRPNKEFNHLLDSIGESLLLAERE
ncbi:DeoR family transcriptional regulator, partial [Amylibacter sp.]|nr:DeoR/GlpR transcriptional regulator [Rhodobacterales bacterium]MDB4245713.1 DeoR family transcriptional regulator [Amylibacter sp.]